MASVVEGYTSAQQGSTPVPAQTSSGTAASDDWIANLRQEARREMIRELALKRIRSGGRENQPSGPSRFDRMVEAFFVGVAVTLVSSWACTKAMSLMGKDEEN